MIKIYEDNGLPFFDEAWLRERNFTRSWIAAMMDDFLRGYNAAWSIKCIEAPCMIPNELVSPEYTDNDVYRTQDFTMKPETTASSYAYAAYLLDHQASKPPLCIWQASKSFRRENDQVSANVRLKEFYQQEFQCIVTKDTKKDYQDELEVLRNTIARITGLPARVVDSDRLPSYSLRTVDIEVKTPRKWLEVCSISKRTDVPFSWNEKELINYEFAFGLDRIVYAKGQSDE